MKTILLTGAGGFIGMKLLACFEAHRSKDVRLVCLTSKEIGGIRASSTMTIRIPLWIF